jgi:hypothetical protein
LTSVAAPRQTPAAATGQGDFLVHASSIKASEATEKKFI